MTKVIAISPPPLEKHFTVTYSRVTEAGEMFHLLYCPDLEVLAIAENKAGVFNSFGELMLKIGEQKGALDF